MGVTSVKAKRICNSLRLHLAHNIMGSEFDGYDCYTKAFNMVATGTKVHSDFLLAMKTRIEVDRTRHISCIILPGNRRVHVNHKSHLHRKKKPQKVTDRKLRSQDKVETRARQQSSGAGRNSQKKKEDFKKPATPVNTSSSDSSPSPILQRSKKALPKNQARKVLSQSQMFDKPSPRSRDYHSESEINDVPRRAGQPLSLSMDVTQSTEKENEKSLHVDSGNKKTENSVISSSTPYPSFFVVKKEVAMDLQTVLRAFCLFHRSIVKKQEKHALNELVSSTMDHWLTMVPIKKITRIMDHVLIEIFEVSETPISNHRSENVDLKVLLASFTSLAQEFGLKMDSRAMEDWNVLKKTYDDKPTFVSVSELDQLLTFHLCRRF